MMLNTASAQDTGRPGTVWTVLKPGMQMRAGDRLVEEGGGATLVLEADGLLQVIPGGGGAPNWTSAEAGIAAVPGGVLELTSEGQMVLRDAAGGAVWAPLGARAVPGAVIYFDEGVLTALSPNWVKTPVLAAETSSAADGMEECVARVHGGGLAWGGGLYWTERNARRLCDGATDTGQRIACFTASLAEGNRWDLAVTRCRRL